MGIWMDGGAMPTQGIQERNTGFPASLFPWYSLAKLGPRQDLFTVSPRERWVRFQGQTESNDSGPRAGPPQVLQ